MFKAKSINAIFELFDLRKSAITNTSKVPVEDSTYLEYIRKYRSFEINPDIQLFDYENALKENKYVEENAPSFCNRVWMFARSGQGDEWFLSTEAIPTVMYYDHNKGDYSLIDQFDNFGISFSKFLQVAFLYRELEEQLDINNDELPKEEEENFITAVSELSPSFYAKYPYKYF